MKKEFILTYGFRGSTHNDGEHVLWWQEQKYGWSYSICIQEIMTENRKWGEARNSPKSSIISPKEHPQPGTKCPNTWQVVTHFPFLMMQTVFQAQKDDKNRDLTVQNLFLGCLSPCWGYVCMYVCNHTHTHLNCGRAHFWPMCPAQS